MTTAAEERILSGSFRSVFGDATLSEALRSPLAQQSTKVRRAIKESYKASQEENQTNTTGKFNVGVDTPDGESHSAVSTSLSNDILNSYDDESIAVVINGVLEVRTFLTKQNTTNED